MIAAGSSLRRNTPPTSIAEPPRSGNGVTHTRKLGASPEISATPPSLLGVRYVPCRRFL